jgi:hypothetical protein
LFHFFLLGGQTPLYKRIPKRGFNNIHATPLDILHIGKLVKFIQCVTNKQQNIYQKCTRKFENMKTKFACKHCFIFFFFELIFLFLFLFRVVLMLPKKLP